jgi:hypothetical protein
MKIRGRRSRIHAEWGLAGYCRFLVTDWKGWLRGGVDLNHRPLGYEFKEKLIWKNLQAHG